MQVQAIKKDDDEKQTSEKNNSDSQHSISVHSKQDEVGDQNKISQMSDEKDYIFPLLFIYRAYGYIVLEEYDKGLKDFIKS